MKIITTSEARNNLQELISEVYFTKEQILITKNSKPRVLIQPIPPDDPHMQKIIAEHTANIEEKKRLRREARNKK